jgi:hypothetical protein
VDSAAQINVNQPQWKPQNPGNVERRPGKEVVGGEGAKEAVGGEGAKG